VGEAGPESCRRCRPTQGWRGWSSRVDHLDADQLRTFLEGARSSRHWTAYLLLATTGLRRGDALGLRWRDLDLDVVPAVGAIRQTVIAVKHTAMLGTPRRRRVGVRSRSTRARLKLSGSTGNGRLLLMGPGWTDNDLVFCHVDGTMLHPERSTRGFSDTVRRLGLPPIRLHDLRQVGQLWRSRPRCIRRWCRSD
jgi:integrase